MTKEERKKRHNELARIHYRDPAYREKLREQRKRCKLK